jgi:hypothetical protein
MSSKRLPIQPPRAAILPLAFGEGVGEAKPFPRFGFSPKPTSDKRQEHNPIRLHQNRFILPHPHNLRANQRLTIA